MLYVAADTKIAKSFQKMLETKHTETFGWSVIMTAKMLFVNSDKDSWQSSHEVPQKGW